MNPSFAFVCLGANTISFAVLTLDGAGLLLRSDNPDFAPIIRQGPDANRVTIYARVVWSGHVWR